MEGNGLEDAECVTRGHFPSTKQSAEVAVDGQIGERHEECHNAETSSMRRVCGVAVGEILDAAVA